MHIAQIDWRKNVILLAVISLQFELACKCVDVSCLIHTVTFLQPNLVKTIIISNKLMIAPVRGLHRLITATSYLFILDHQQL